MLIEAGAELEVVDQWGRTALHWAAAADRKDVVAMLLEAGADATPKEREGKTAHDLARSDEMRGLLPRR